MIVLGLVIILSGLGSVSATSYYVSPTGNDANGGTDATTDAWATLEYALEDGGLAEGDILYLTAGTHDSLKSGTNNYTNLALGAGDGSNSLIITANPNDEGSVIIDMPNNTLTNIGYFYLNDAGITMSFNNINFTNTNSNPTTWFDVRGGWLEVNDSVLNNNNVNDHYIVAFVLTSGGEVSFNRVKIEDVGQGVVTFGSINGTFKLKASEIVNQSSFLVVAGSGINVTLEIINNVFYDVQGPYIAGSGNFSSIKMVNNIFYLSKNDESGVFNTNEAFEKWVYDNNGGDFVFKNNVVWKNASTMGGSAWNKFGFSGSGFYSILIDKSNKFIDPGFVNAPTDLSISNTSHILGLGNNSELPSIDINGNSWIGSDVGAYAMPSSTKYNYALTSNKVAFLGDSIFCCSGSYFGADENCVYRKFANMTGLDVADCDVGSATYKPSSNGGAAEIGIWIADYILENLAPETVFVSLGINNFYDTDATGDNDPDNVNSSDVARMITETMEKLEDAGVTPIWMGIGSLTDGQNESDALNSAMEIICEANGWKYGSILDRMRLDSSWNATYFDDNGYGLSTNCHPDDEGHYLMASLAENLYYGRDAYHVYNANVDGLQIGSYQNPLTLTQLNALTSIPTGESGRTINMGGGINGSWISSTGFNPSANGSSGKVFTLKGGHFTAENIFDQPYWKWIGGISESSNDDGIINNATNNEFYNLVIYNSSGDGIELTENTTIKNCVFENIGGSDINENGGTANNTATNYADSDGNPLFVNTSGYMNQSLDFQLKWNSPLINIGTDLGFTTDPLDNPIYETQDIGAYEYQPPYNISQDVINTSISKSIRIYGDGNYRHLNFSIGNVIANLIIDPTTIFNSTNYSSWMDLNITTWTNSLMSWVESSDIIGDGNTTHTICDLTSGSQYDTYYTNSSNNKILIARYTVDSSGCIEFNYIEGYSTITFDVELYTPTTITTPSSDGSSPTYQPTESNLEKGYSKVLKKDWKIEFEFENKTHVFNVDEVKNDSVVISVESDKQTFELRINETKKLNLNSDSFYDLEIFLKGIDYRGADLTIKSIHEEIPAEELKDKIKESLEDNLLWLWIVLGLVVVVAVLVGIGYKKKGRKKGKGKRK